MYISSSCYNNITSKLILGGRLFYPKCITREPLLSHACSPYLSTSVSLSTELCFPMFVTSDSGDCFAQRLISYAFFNGFFSLPCFLFVMAIARSLGNRVRHTKAWRSVETSNMETIVDDMNESVKARPLLITVGTCSAYLIVAIEAVVMGNV